MENINIYNKSGNLVLIAPVTDDCERAHTLQSENYILLSWNANTKTVLNAGSYILYNSEKFLLIENYYPEKQSSDHYLYNVKFRAIEASFIKPIFFRYVIVDGKTWKEPEFSINSNLFNIGIIIIDSINRANLGVTFSLSSGSKYMETELKALTFSGVNIADAISYVAEQFDTEWWVEDGNILHFDKCEFGNFIDLSDEYDQVNDVYTSKGLESVSLSDRASNIPQRVYPYGSERNITKKTMNTEDMNISFAKRLCLDEKIYPLGYIEVPNVTSGIEEVVFFDEIYPRREGTLSSVRVAGTIEVPIYYIADSQVPNLFNPRELLIDGCTIMLQFTSGYLNGFEFEVNWKAASNEFEIINKSEDDQQMPFGIFIPKRGDTYVLFNMKMPDNYIMEAKDELALKALEYIKDVETSVPETKCKSDPLFFKERGIEIKCGCKVQVSSEEYNGGILQSRVTNYSYNLTTPYDISFTLSSARVTGRLAAIENAIHDQTNQIDGIHQDNRAISRRGWRDAYEMSEMFNSIVKELGLFGAEENQFVTSCVILFNNANKQLSVTKGNLVHALYRDNPASGVWLVQTTTITVTPTNGYGNDIPYYIYAKCSKSNNIALIVLSVNKVACEEVEGYYHFLIGTLSSIFETRRVFKQTSGLTLIAGGNITTEQIQDVNRNLIIDFASYPPRIVARNGAEIIAPKITFRNERGDDVDFGADEYAQIGADISDAKDAAISEAHNALLASQWSSGEFLFKNVAFQDDTLLDPYYPGAGVHGTIARLPSTSDNGNPINNSLTNPTNGIMRMVTTSHLAYDGYRGGFHFNTISRANAIFVCRIIAKIAIGHNIEWASNQTGHGRIDTWATPTKGTGNWEEYIHILRCGAVGVFSTTSYFFLITEKDRPLAEATWDVAYACCSDITNVKNANTIANDLRVRNMLMADDDVITIEEKAQLRRDWIEINGDGTLNGSGTYWRLKKVANTHNIDTLTLDNAFSGISTAFGSSWVNISLYEDYTFMNVAGVSKRDYIAKFSAWDAAVQDMSNRIAQEGINNIEIGGVNLFSMLKLNPVGYAVNSSREIGGIDIVFKANNPNNWAITPISNKNPLVPINTDFTISFDLRNTIGAFGIEITGTTATATLMGRLNFANPSNTWKRFSQTYNSGSLANIGGINLFGVGEIRHIKFETGNKSTAWSINPDDVEEMKLIGEAIGGVSTKGLIYYNNFNSVSDMENPRLGFNTSGTYPTFISTGKVTNAATFNGTNHFIKTCIDPTKQLMGDFTISAWINPTAWGNYRGIGGDHVSVGLVFGQAEGSTVNFGVATANTWADIKLSVGNLKINNWYHVVMRVSDGRINLFVNNIYKGTSPNFTTRKFINTFYIGQAGSGSDRKFSGQIDEFMVFDRALSEDEITNLYFQNDHYLNEAMKKGSTDIQGGVVLSQVMGVKNINNELTGGISGLTGAGDAVRMFFASKGVSMAEANEAAGKLSGDSSNPMDINQKFRTIIDKFGNLFAGNAFLSGDIYADSGNFGGMQIDEEGLVMQKGNVRFSPNKLPSLDKAIVTGLETPACYVYNLLDPLGNSISGRQVSYDRDVEYTFSSNIFDNIQWNFDFSIYYAEYTYLRNNGYSLHIEFYTKSFIMNKENPIKAIEDDLIEQWFLEGQYRRKALSICLNVGNFNSSMQPALKVCARIYAQKKYLGTSDYRIVNGIISAFTPSCGAIGMGNYSLALYGSDGLFFLTRSAFNNTINGYSFSYKYNIFFLKEGDFSIINGYLAYNTGTGKFTRYTNYDNQLEIKQAPNSFLSYIYLGIPQGNTTADALKTPSRIKGRLYLDYLTGNLKIG